MTDGEPKTAVSASLQKRDTSERLHLVVNFEKSQVVIFINGGYIAARKKWFYDGMKLKTVNHYKYLDITLSTGLTFLFLLLLFCCPINCADFRGTAPAPLVPASPTSGHTQGSFCIVAPPLEVHRK